MRASFHQTLVLVLFCPQIKQMLHCLLINNTCSLFQQVAPEPIVVSSNNYTTPLYVSVIGNQRRQLLVNYMKGLMLYLTGESVSNATSADKCVSLNAPDQKVKGSQIASRSHKQNDG